LNVFDVSDRSIYVATELVPCVTPRCCTMRSSTSRAPFDPRARDAGVAEQSSKLDVLDLVLAHAKSQVGQREVCALLRSSKPAAALTAR
jgi:hypothetical protein